MDFPMGRWRKQRGEPIGGLDRARSRAGRADFETFEHLVRYVPKYLRALEFVVFYRGSMEYYDGGLLASRLLPLSWRL